ncbi:MAG: adenylate/guanylate cyclase domain-containing protein [Bacteroidota bacterium]|nr:adenylate/guanylate cyclase domain-containing protein [Bacteroidota bacterium]
MNYIHFTDPNSKEIEQLLGSIPFCPGTCFFIDIVGSTQIKYTESLASWGKKLNNTFNFISIINDFPQNVVKGIGDEIMLFIPDEELKQKSAYNDYFSLLQEIYATLDNIKNFPVEGLFLDCKVAIHYCTDAYNISFLEGANDYYGRDIDLTARLTTKAKVNRIVLSERFYELVMNDFREKHAHNRNSAIEKVSGKYIEDFKGVPAPTEFRIIGVE